MNNMADNKWSEQTENHLEIKTRVSNQVKRLHEWKEYFKNLPRNPLEIIEKPIKMINSQLDIKLRLFAEKELDAVSKKIKSRKATVIDKIPPEVWKTRKFDDIHFWLSNAVYRQNSIEKYMKSCILPFPMKRKLGIIKNYRSMTLGLLIA